MTDLPKYYIIIIIFVAIPKWQQQSKPSTSVMMKFQISSIYILKQGLTKLHNQNQERKARLTAKFQAGQPISEIDCYGTRSASTLNIDQEWLDGNGNLVNEEWVVGTLDNVSDYEQGLARLNSHDKTVADKLQKVAEGGGKCCTCSACHGILFPFPFRATLCRSSPNCLCRAVQARLCCKCCRHIIGLGPYRLSMTSHPSP